MNGSLAEEGLLTLMTHHESVAALVEQRGAVAHFADRRLAEAAQWFISEWKLGVPRKGAVLYRSAVPDRIAQEIMLARPRDSNCIERALVYLATIEKQPLQRSSAGSIYRRGHVLWIKYRHNGEVIRESSHSDNYTDAEQLLRERIERLRLLASSNQGGLMVKFYRDKVQGRTEVCIETDAADEREFLDAVAQRLPDVLAKADGDSEVRDWLRRVVDITCKMRGYKAEVIERRVIQAGALPPADAACIASTAPPANGHDTADRAAPLQ